MTATIDRTTTAPKRVLMVVANPTTSTTTGWPVGFWASELFHPLYEFTEAGYDVTVASPDGGPVQVDGMSDPRDESRYSVEDVLSLGYLSSEEQTAPLRDTPSLADLDLEEYDAIVVCGGQSPMFTFRDNADLQAALRRFYEAEKPTAALCHGVSALVDVRLSDGSYLVEGRTVTGFARGAGCRRGRRDDRDAVAHRGRPAGARCQLRRGRPVESVRGARRAPHHGPAAVQRAQGRRTGHRGTGGLNVRIGVIGAGRIGGNAARLFAKAGHEVLVSFSRDQAKLEALAAEIAGRAGTPREAVQFGEVVMLSVSWTLIDDVLADAGPFDGKVVIDTTNQFGREGRADLGGRTAAQVNAARMPGARYTKAFNTLTSAFQAEAAGRTGPDRVVMFLCGDDEEAKGIVSGLIDDAGFTPVDMGGIADAAPMEAPRREGAVYGEEAQEPQGRELVARLQSA